jgi:hypothetical protein
MGAPRRYAAVLLNRVCTKPFRRSLSSERRANNPYGFHASLTDKRESLLGGWWTAKKEWPERGEGSSAEREALRGDVGSAIEEADLAALS